ncbi:MAG: glutamine amidotransferase [Bacteroidetes bacterium]|nr:glutamine amidotransferase [Bacteroidota bacterium]MCY4204256.1 glutamine amidotransferase [Bacteroidota bacterium]
MFKFDAIQFAEGTITLQASVLALTLLVIVLVILGITFLRSEAPLHVRGISLGLRSAAALLLIFPLFEPRLVVPEVVPDENFVAVIVDVSDSMLLPDGPQGQTRLEWARELVYGPESGILQGIDDLFKVRLYVYASSVTRADSIYRAVPVHETDLAAALDRVRMDFRGIPLTGVVILTDGNTTNRQEALDQADLFQDQGIGVHAIGIGSSAFTAERELLEVIAHKGLGEEAGTELEVKIRSFSSGPDPATIAVYDGDVEVYSESVRLKGDGLIDQMEFFFEPPASGAREYRITLETAVDELNTLNNSLPLLIDSRTDTLRVLYFEGHLRQEYKFVKRALESDPVIHFASITRTGTGKYYRQGILSPDELVGGFPTEADVLYDFDTIILGDVEASAFSLRQMQLIESFVRVRGGGFVMLGGRNAFAEGDYAGTPIADLLPVRIDHTRIQVLPMRFEGEEGDRGYVFEPTPEGLEHPFMKLSPDASVNRILWREMPRLTSINFLGGAKPGAQILAMKSEDHNGSEESILTIQRYGKGRTAALATSSTWRWQMLLEAEDERHERFWKQFARWLAASAPARVDLETSGTRLAPEESHQLGVRVYDETYLPLTGIELHAMIQAPDRTIQSLSTKESLSEDGRFKIHFTPEEQGVYELMVEAVQDGELIGRNRGSYLVRHQPLEYYNATLKQEFLEQMATVYYTPAEISDVRMNLQSRQTSTSVYRAAYLWDMPLLFILSILLLCGEWLYRRRQGLR